MLQSRSAFRALAKNRTNSPSPSSRQGRLFQPFSRISVFYLLGSNLLLLKKAANMVLEIALDLDQQRPAGE